MRSKLRGELEVAPSRSSIYRALIRHGLIDPKTRRRRRQDYKRWERSRSMELWQMDVMGRVFLAEGQHAELANVTVTADKSPAVPVPDDSMPQLAPRGL